MAGNEPLWDNGDLDESTDFGTSGLAGLPGGFRTTIGGFTSSPNRYADFWSSSGLSSSAWSRGMWYFYTIVLRYPDSKLYGYSVRCIED